VEQMKTCVNCGRDLVQQGLVWVCDHCNSDISEFRVFIEPVDSEEYAFIECPGASLYEPGTTEVVQGVQFLDDENPSKGFRIIGRPVYAPTHTKLRRIKREAVGRIRRCQGCQDYTIRMRRPEGPDFFIPSSKYPGRKKLKTVSHRSTA
jgi:hypothetical protein